MGRSPTREDLTRRIRELEQENLDLRSALEEREAEHRRILDIIDEGYYELDLKGNITSFNQAACSLLGYEPHEMPGMSYRDYTSPDTARRMYEVFHRIYETGNPERLVDYDVLCRDGSVRNHELSAGLRRDKSGRPIGFHVLVHDVTSRKQAEVILKRSEERYRNILENMEEAYFELDLKGTYTFANAAVHRMLGYDRTEIIGLNYRSYMSPETAKRMFDVFNRIYLTGEPQHLVDYEVIRKDGTIRVNEMNAAPLRDTSGNMVGFRGVGRDVTERKKAEDALRQSEWRYRSILESMEEAYYEVDLEGNFTFFNSRAVNRLGYTLEELSGMNYRQYMDEENARKVFDAYHQVFLTGKPMTGFAWELKSKQAQPIFVEASISLRRNAEGVPVGFFGVVRDITERKRAEEALRASEEKYRGILESMQESYFEVDLKGNFTFFNTAAVLVSGYSKEELMGMNYRQYSPPETAKLLFEAFHRVYETGNPEIIVDYEVIHKDGTLRDNEMSVWPMLDASGATVGFHSLVRDVTERKRTERAIRQSEERYRTIFENTGSSSLLIGNDTTILLANSNFEKLTGYSKEEMEGKMSWTEFVDKADLERMKSCHQNRRIDPSSAPQSYEFRLRNRSGETRDIYITVAMIPGTMESVASCIDITERKKAEEALRQSEARYRFLTENMGDMAFTVDLDMRTVYVSPSVEKILGFTVEERKLQKPEDQLTPASYANAIETLARELERDRKEGLDPDRPIMIELEYYHKDGSTRYLETNCSAVRDANGNVTGIHGISRDITERKKAEEALRQSEERWQFALEGAGDGLWDYDIELGRIYRSRRWKEMLGYSEADIGESPDEWSRLVNPEDRQHADDELNRHLAGETPVYVHEHRIRCKDGSYKWILDRGKVVRWSEDGRPLRIIGTHTDTTERKQAEAALRESEERYRTIFESTATANIIVAEDTTILLANSNFEKLTGFSRSELEGKMSWTSFVVEEDLETMRQRHFQRRKDPDSVISAYEFKARVRSGEVRNLYMSVSMIPETKESVASLIDMTDRIQAEEALRQSEERFRDLARLLPETVFETDSTGNITFVNEISLERFGFTREDVEHGINILDVLAPQDHERAIRNYARVMRGERLGLSEYTAQRKDGTTFPALVHSTSIFREGRQAGLRGFLIDVTEKKSLEEQLMRSQKLEAIGTLAGGIAHDFNNLLMGILGNISLMLMNFDESHPFHDRLKSMEEYVQRGSDLTKQLLGFARGGKYEVKSTDLGEFVRRSAEMFGRTKKEIRMHHKAQGDLWAVEVDRGQMEQVMLNLFVNAWQAMPGGGDLFLSVENAELGTEEVSPYGIKPGRFVKLTVTDTGVGMDAATKARIFEPFFSTKERGRGTGLGLASVYGIIKNHGGFILVDSEKDIGTSFTVYLPASDKSIEREKRALDQVYKGRETVLIIDDEEMIVDVGASMLESLGYRVLTASGGRQGLQIFDRNKGAIDLVILDMVMPDLGGKETFEALRRQDPQVRVLLSSGYSLDGQAKEILSGGCRGFIQKPFTMAELSRRIRDILDER